MNLNNSATQIKAMGIQMINLGIQILNIGIEMPDMNNDLNILQQIQNISNQIKNIEMKMNNPMKNNMGMNNNKMMNMGMNPMNNMGMMYDPMPMQMGNPMNNIMIEEPKNKINTLFETPSGFKKSIIVDYGTSVSDMIKKYFNEIGKPELFRNDKICFLYDACKLNCDDNTKVENFFQKTSLIHHIVVVDLFNMLIDK